jgi:hypothetical protein
MKYPTLATGAPVAFVLALDVVQGPDGSFQIAETHLQSGLAQLAGYWLPGLVATLSAGLAKKVVVVGGHEQRYGTRVIRPAVIADMMCGLGVDPSRFEWLRSEPNTIGNAEAIAGWLDANAWNLGGADPVVVCAYWHVARAALDLGCQGIDAPVVPAEAVWLAASADGRERSARRAELAEYFGGSFGRRAAGECNGIADKLCRSYTPLSELPSPVVRTG